MNKMHNLRIWIHRVWKKCGHKSSKHTTIRIIRNFDKNTSIRNRLERGGVATVVKSSYDSMTVLASSLEAEKQSNCEIGSNIMHEWGDDGWDGDIFHCSNQQMTQQTAQKCWGMIVEWVWSDGRQEWGWYDRNHLPACLFVASGFSIRSVVGLSSSLKQPSLTSLLAANRFCTWVIDWRICCTAQQCLLPSLCSRRLEG